MKKQTQRAIVASSGLLLLALLCYAGWFAIATDGAEKSSPPSAPTANLGFERADLDGLIKDRLSSPSVKAKLKRMAEVAGVDAGELEGAIREHLTSESFQQDVSRLQAILDQYSQQVSVDKLPGLQDVKKVEKTIRRVPIP